MAVTEYKLAVFFVFKPVADRKADFCLCSCRINQYPVLISPPRGEFLDIIQV